MEPIEVPEPTPFVVIRLDGAPRGKGRPRTRVIKDYATIYTDEKTRDFENKLKAAGIKAMAGLALLDEALSVSVTAYMPIPKSFSKAKYAAAVAFDLAPTVRPDGDNFLKIALDSLNKVVWIDDSIIVFSSILKVYSATPRMVIEVRKWND